MEYIAIGVLALACGYLMGKVDSIKKILELEEENYNLNTWKANQSDAERRATTFARKLKRLEDIAIEGEKNNDCAPVTLAKIKKELLITR